MTIREKHDEDAKQGATNEENLAKFPPSNQLMPPLGFPGVSLLHFEALGGAASLLCS